MYRILFILSLGGTLATPTYNIQDVKNKAGLFYEPMREVRLSRTEWRLATYIDLRSFENRRPSYTKLQLDAIQDDCFFILKLRCRSLINKQDIFHKTAQIDKYLSVIRKFHDEERLETRSAPLGIIGTISKSLFGTLNDDDARYFNNQIDKLYLDQKDIISLTKNQTHVIKSELHSIHKHLDHLEEQHNLTWEVTKKMFEETKERYVENYAFRLHEWKSSMDLIANTYISSLRTIIDALYFAKLGFLHPDLLSPTALETVVKNFMETHHNLIFPVPLDEIHSGSLSRISRLSATYHDGRIILVMHIPLVEPTPYSLFKLHSYPTPQTFGNNNNSGAYIHPRASHFMISREQDKYTLISEEELRHCHQQKTYQICTPSYPIYDVATYPTCELLLMTGGNQQIYKDCDVRIMKKQAPYWKQLETTKGWLFALPHPEKLHVICDNEAQTLELTGTGILNLQPGCIAKTSYATMVCFQTFENNIESHYTPEASLDVSELLPNISTFQPLQDIDSMYQTTPIVMSEYSPETTNYDLSLSEIERQLGEIEKHKREKVEQSFQTQAIIGGEIMIVITFLLYAIRKQVITGIKTLLASRKTTNDPAEDHSANSYEGTENPHDEVHIDEVIYDVPIRPTRPLPRSSTTQTA